MAILSLAALWASSSAEADETPVPVSIEKAVNRSLPLLQKSLTEYPHHATCFSCHHQGVAMFALPVARTRGYPVETKGMDAVAAQTTADLRGDLANYRKGQGQPGGVTRAGWPCPCSLAARNATKSQRR